MCEQLSCEGLQIASGPYLHRFQRNLGKFMHFRGRQSLRLNNILENQLKLLEIRE